MQILHINIPYILVGEVLCKKTALAVSTQRAAVSISGSKYVLVSRRHAKVVPKDGFKPIPASTGFVPAKRCSTNDMGDLRSLCRKTC